MARRKDVTPVIFIQSDQSDVHAWGDDTRYAHINCQILVIDHEDDRGHPVNPSDWLGARFDDIQIHCQIDSSTARGYRDNSDGTTFPTERSYGWEIGINSMGLLKYRQLEQVIKTLRKMNKAVNGETFVHYADYVVAAGKSIGAKFVMTHHQNGGNYAEWDWEYLSQEGARAYINRLEDSICRKLTGQEAA